MMPRSIAQLRSIKFARLVQIFYPFSLQTHPHSFPGEKKNSFPGVVALMTKQDNGHCHDNIHRRIYSGESPKDCPRDAKPDRCITSSLIEIKTNIFNCNGCQLKRWKSKSRWNNPSGQKCWDVQMLTGQISMVITEKPNSHRSCST